MLKQYAFEKRHRRKEKMGILCIIREKLTTTKMSRKGSNAHPAFEYRVNSPPPSLASRRPLLNYVIFIQYNLFNFHKAFKQKGLLSVQEVLPNLI